MADILDELPDTIVCAAQMTVFTSEIVSYWYTIHNNTAIIDDARVCLKGLVEPCI